MNEFLEDRDDHEDEMSGAMVEHVPNELHAALALIADIADDATIEELEGIALAAGGDLANLLGVLQTPEGQRLANAARVRGVQSGGLLQVKARRALNTGIDRIQQALRNRETSAATVGKLVEIVNRLSGLAEERAVQLKVSPAPTSFIGFYTTGPGDPEPPPPAPGELRFHIHFAGPSTTKTERTVPGKVIDAGVVSDQ